MLVRVFAPSRAPVSVLTIRDEAYQARHSSSRVPGLRSANMVPQPSIQWSAPGLNLSWFVPLSVDLLTMPTPASPPKKSLEVFPLVRECQSRPRFTLPSGEQSNVLDPTPRKECSPQLPAVPFIRVTVSLERGESRASL